MFIKRLLPFLKSHKRLYPFKKKLAAFFVFACMSVNGFIPGSVEISKYSFVMVMAAVTQNAVSEVFKKCGSSLILISNKVSFEALRLLSDGRLAEKTLNKDAEDEKNNTADDKALVIKHEILKEPRKIKEDVKGDIAAAFFVLCAKLYSLYRNYKIPDGKGGGVFILMVLLLIISIVRKKEYEDNIVQRFNIFKKTGVPA